MNNVVRIVLQRERKKAIRNVIQFFFLKRKTFKEIHERLFSHHVLEVQKLSS